MANIIENHRTYKTIIFCILLCVLVRIDGERKSRRMNENYDNLPIYDLYPYDQLPNDKQISTFLYKGQTKTFYYTSLINSIPISITISACTSPIYVEIINSLNNSNTYSDKTVINETITNNEMKTITYTTTDNGHYKMYVTSIENDTYIHIYVSTEQGGPEALKNINKFLNNVKLIKRRRKKQLTVRWEPSLVDPQKTVYCLIVSSQMYYNSLCSAQKTTYGIVPSNIKNNKLLSTKHLIDQQTRDPSVYCVGSRTHYTLTNLKEGYTYYFNLFAIDKQSNFTYPHGKAMDVFDNDIKPISLKDGKSTYVNLKKYDGKAVLRFKVSNKQPGKTLELYLMPCGSAIDVEISLKRKMIQMKRGIEGFGRLIINNPKAGARYYIKIITSYKDELTKQSGVELYCTTKSNLTLPLPIMPFQLSVKEYVSLRTCDSVTVGWYASPSKKLTRYCLVVKEGRLREMEGYRMPNQCGLENRLKKSADFAVKYCIDKKSSNEPVITQKISQLKPRKSYIVQVTAKKPKGKTLSYELLQVHTKSCGHLLNKNN